MKPIAFPGCNVVYGQNQPEYEPLPAQVHSDGLVLTCWSMTWRERLTAFFKGRLYISVLTYNMPLQPLKVTVKVTV